MIARDTKWSRNQEQKTKNYVTKWYHSHNNIDIIHGLCDKKYNCYLGGAIIIYSKRVGIRRIKNLVYLRYNKFFHYSIRSEFKKWSVWKWSEQNPEQFIPSLKFWNREMDRSGEEKRMLVNKTIYFSAPMWLKNCIRWWVENQSLITCTVALKRTKRQELGQRISEWSFFNQSLIDLLKITRNTHLQSRLLPS